MVDTDQDALVTVQEVADALDRYGVKGVTVAEVAEWLLRNDIPIAERYEDPAASFRKAADPVTTGGAGLWKTTSQLEFPPRSTSAASSRPPSASQNRIATTGSQTRATNTIGATSRCHVSDKVSSYHVMDAVTAAPIHTSRLQAINKCFKLCKDSAEAATQRWVGFAKR